jgi:hypothetical protein
LERIMDENSELVEPREEDLPDKPPVPDVEEDTSIPDAEKVAEEEYQSPEVADADPETDNREGEMMMESQTAPDPNAPPVPEPPAEEGAGGEEEKYDGGPIPGAAEPAEPDESGESE